MAELVDVMLADFPGMEANPDFLQEMPRNVHAVKDPDVTGADCSEVAAELRRRALRARNRG